MSESKEGVTKINEESVNNELSNCFIFNRFLLKAKNSRKISRSDELESSLAIIINSINKFNKIDEFDNIFDGFSKAIRVDEIKVPHEFSFLISPKSVRVNPIDLQTKDVGIKFSINVPKSLGMVVSYNDYMEAISNFRRHFKKDGMSDLDELSTLRQSKALFDVLGRASFIKARSSEYDLLKSKVHYFDSHIWPIFINEEVDCLFKETYCNANFRDVFEDFMLNIDFA